MYKPVTRLCSSFVALALIASTVPAAAAPAPTNPPPPSTYTVTFPASTVSGTLFPRFAGLSITETLANNLRTAQGDGRALLDWGKCPQLSSSGMPGLLSLSHCIRLTLGTNVTQTSYLVVDLPCPAGNPSAACYGGYVIASRADGTLHREVYGGETTVDRQSRVRVGYKRVMYSFTTGQQIVTYILPVTPAVVVDLQTIRSTSSLEVHATATAATGEVLFQHDSLMIANLSGLSCEDKFEQAIADGQFYTAVAAYGVSGAIAIGGTAAAIAIAVTGGVAGIGTLGAGSTLAIAVGGMVGTASLAMSTSAYIGITDIGTAWTMSDAIDQRNKCRMEEMLEDNPITLPEILDEMSEMTSGASDSGLDDYMSEGSCGNSSSSTVTIDGEECHEECEQSWEDGECVTACVTVCG